MRVLPPSDAPTPAFHLLEAGSLLWRVHRNQPDGSPSPLFSTRFARPGHERQPWGGRFDATPDHPYPFCYAAKDEQTALVELFARRVPLDGGRRFIPEASLRDRTMVLLETMEPLWLVSLTTTAELAAVHQDTWLVHAGSADYPFTQLWGHWLRSAQPPTSPAGTRSPWAAPRPVTSGMIWPSKRHLGGHAILLFGDRCADAVRLSPFGSRRLDDIDGRAWLDRRLRPFGLGCPPLGVPTVTRS